jgi:glutamine synthetase
MYTKESVLTDISTNNIELIDLQFTDILGVTKSVTIPADTLEDVMERGLWFDGSSIYGFARIQESDMLLQPDPVTYRVLPWVEQPPLRARIICDILTAEGEPFPGDPRYALKRAIAKAEAMGFSTYNIGPELEFFLFRKNGGTSILEAVPHDVGGYFDFSPNDEAERVRSAITTALQKLNITVEMNHHEVAIGQHEIDFRSNMGCWRPSCPSRSSGRTAAGCTVTRAFSPAAIIHSMTRTTSTNCHRLLTSLSRGCCITRAG